MTNRNNTDYLLLFDQYLAGDIDEDGMNRLLVMVQTDSAIRTAWKEAVLADFLLREKAASQKFLLDETPLDDWDILIDLQRNETPIAHEPIAEKERPETCLHLSPESRTVTTIPRRKPQQKWSRHLPLIISILVLLALIIPTEWRYYQQPNQPTEQPFVAVAYIAEMVDPVWKSPAHSFKRHEELDQQKLSLESGLVKIVYKSGAQLVLEGPTEFLVSGDNDGWCESGSLSAHVPASAVGFEIKTPFASVIDRGTDFTVQINEDQAEISVVNGKVDLRQTGMPALSLTTGAGQKYSRSGMSQPITARVDRYIDHTRFQGQLDRYVQRVELQQRELSNQMEGHPNLLVHFLLNNSDRSEVANRSQRGATMTDQAQVQHCIANEGSLPGRQSLRFNQRDSAVAFTLPVKISDMTMIASVCVDQPKNQGNVLASSNEHGMIPGSFLWQLAADGRFFFQITGNHKEIDFFPSPIVLTPARRYTWSQIALVADSKKKEIRFYQDGKQVGRNDWPHPILLVPGAMTLGNTALQEKLTSRFLNGAMENFSLFDCAMSDEEIRNLTGSY